MARQLTLLDTPPAWQIDDATREVGRRGVAEARAELEAAIAARRSAEAAKATHQHPAPGRSAARTPPSSHPPLGTSVSALMGILAWCVMGLLAGGLARRAVGAPKRGCLTTIAIGIVGALLAGAAAKFATGDEIGTFDELDLGSVFV